MRRRTIDLLAGIGLVTLLAAGAADAQSLGGVLERLGRRAVDRAATTATRPRSDRPATLTAPIDKPIAVRPAEPAPPGVTPWPINAGQVERAYQFAFAPELEEEKRRFQQASSFRCMTCEGSLDFDSWRRAFQPLRDTDTAWSELLSGWTAGRELSWRGTAHDGTIRVVSEVPVAGVPCRQLRHRISTRGPRPVVHERAGLLCLDRKEYGRTPLWHEVF
jgi:hypothetical protein